jgi:hypothetical protein
MGTLDQVKEAGELNGRPAADVKAEACSASRALRAWKDERDGPATCK